ncbi:hypothetical protein [Priestia aryabhattai]
MGFSKKEIESISNYSKKVGQKSSKDIQYPGRKSRSNDSREYVANNKVAQKAIRNVLGLKK